jgi:hypothetical protein
LGTFICLQASLELLEELEPQEAPASLVSQASHVFADFTILVMSWNSLSEGCVDTALCTHAPTYAGKKSMHVTINLELSFFGEQVPLASREAQDFPEQQVRLKFASVS